MLTECGAACAPQCCFYGWCAFSGIVVNSFQSKDGWARAQQRKVNQPIDLDTLMWVRNRLMRLEVEMRWADRICLFEEFFPNDALIPRI